MLRKLTTAKRMMAAEGAVATMRFTSAWISRRFRQTVSDPVRYQAFTARASAIRLLARLRRRSKKDKLIVFDPDLRGYNGHHFEYAQVIKAGFATAFDVRFYANFWMPTRLAAEFHAQPICFDSIYCAASEDFQITNARAHASVVAALERINLHELSPRTIFVIHTLTIYQLSGLAEWFVKLPSSHRPKLFLKFHGPLDVFGILPDSDWPAALAIARDATNRLSSTGRVIFAATNDLLKDRLSVQLGHTWQVVYVPFQWPNPAQNVSQPPGLVFGFFGGLRFEKGSRLLAEAICAFTERYPDSHFIVHAPPTECDEVAAQRLSNCPQVELIRKNFKTKDEYFTQFCRARCILLPYDPDRYALRVSGIFVEALGLGRPVIVTDGTWMERQLHKHSAAGLVMRSYSAGALYDCLEGARDAFLQQSWNSGVDHEIMSSHSGSAFCAALIKAVEA